MSTRLLRLPDFDFQQSEDSEDLEPGVFHMALHCRVTAQVSISGGTTDGTLLSEGVQRLIRNVRIVWDSVDIVDNISGRELFQLSARGVDQSPEDDQLSAAGTAVANEDIGISFTIWLARPWLVNPFNTAFPPVNINSQLKMYVTWETSAAGTGSSDAGTGALITGGDRDVVFDEGPEMTVVQEISDTGDAPWYVPAYSSFDTTQWDAANARLTTRLVSERKFDLFIFRMVQGANAEPQDGLNSLRMKSGSVQHLDAIPAPELRRIERNLFAGVGVETGYHGVRMASGGKLGNLFDPTQWPATTFELDVDAPTGSPGQGRFTMSELLSVENVSTF